MLSVADALAMILADAAPLPSEMVALGDAHGRTLAEDLQAKLTQPPFAASAMDGYAVRRVDLASLPVRLTLIGSSAAGHPFGAPIGPSEAVRIFTGAVVPDGADWIVIQENTRPENGAVTVLEAGDSSNIRPLGGDFHAGQTLLPRGKRLNARDLMLAAQMNQPAVPVIRRPKVAILASGDEILPPGSQPGPGQIISSIPAALASLIRQWGGEPTALGIARDTMESLGEFIESASGHDILVTIGGASVGDHDLVSRALQAADFSMGFHKIAMRPGKPLMYGGRGAQRVLGVPGNPVSAVLCSYIFLLPLIAALTGQADPQNAEMTAELAAPIEANGPRQHYMRARFIPRAGSRLVAPMPSQDSSLITMLATAECLIIRPPYAPPAEAGEEIPILPLDF